MWDIYFVYFTVKIPLLRFSSARLPEFTKVFCPEAECTVYCLAMQQQTNNLPPPPIPNLTNKRIKGPKPVNFGSEFLTPTKPIWVGGQLTNWKKIFILEPLTLALICFRRKSRWEPTQLKGKGKGLSWWGWERDWADGDGNGTELMRMGTGLS